MYIEDSPIGSVKVIFKQNKGDGMTHCHIVSEGKEIGYGKTRCSLKEPTGFVPKKGKKIALLVAMTNAGWDKERRTPIWHELDRRGWLREGEKFRG